MNGSRRNVAYLNAKFDGVASLAPKLRDEWPPFPSSKISYSKVAKTKLMVSLSVDIESQMVAVTQET
jgi:hypothetical protein